MHDTWLYHGNGFIPNYIKEALRSRTKNISIQEQYADKNNYIYFET